MTNIMKLPDTTTGLWLGNLLGILLLLLAVAYQLGGAIFASGEDGLLEGVGVIAAEHKRGGKPGCTLFVRVGLGNQQAAHFDIFWQQSGDSFFCDFSRVFARRVKGGKGGDRFGIRHGNRLVTSPDLGGVGQKILKLCRFPCEQGYSTCLCSGLPPCRCWLKFLA